MAAPKLPAPKIKEQTADRGKLEKLAAKNQDSAVEKILEEFRVQA